MSKVTQEQKSTLWWLKLTNWLLDFPYLKNNVFFKVIYRTAIEFNKDKLSEAIKDGNRLYKELDEIDEQLDGNLRELKNIFGEILEETNLFFKKFDEDEEGENEKKLKNILKETLKHYQAAFQILSEMEDSLVKPERSPAKMPGYVEYPDEDSDEYSDEDSGEDSE